MNEYCTCGAKLPEEARFCHKCGKPQVELLPDEISPEEPEASAPAAAPAEPPKQPLLVNFRNPIAVRTAFTIGFVSAFAVTLPIPSAVQFVGRIVMLLTAGFVSSYLYYRRTGQSLTVKSGARMGWITGVFSFLVILILSTMSIVGLAIGGEKDKLIAQMAEASGSPQVADKVRELLSDPTGFALVVFASLAMLFCFFSLITSAGGALGAKVLQKE